MNIAICKKCLYSDGQRLDRTYKCCTPERQLHADKAQDCFIDENKLRKLQMKTKTAQEFIFATQQYIKKAKEKSMYWRAQTKKNGL